MDWVSREGVCFVSFSLGGCYVCVSEVGGCEEMVWSSVEVRVVGVASVVPISASH